MDYKKDFPIFTERPELIYLDNAATSQKPKQVLEAISEFYSRNNANIHRGPHFLAEEATLAYESARKTVADFIKAKYAHEIVFTRNATEAVNLIAHSFGESLKKGDEVLLSKAEHHANIVPWLQLKERKGINLRYLELDENGCVIIDPTAITPDTKLVALSGMSNVTGDIPDLSSLIAAAHSAGAKVLVDACQLILHRPIDVQSLDADFLVFSGHKLYGPTGIGVLYAKESLLKSMPPFLGGGDMINEVFEDHFTPADLPAKFEAGTPNIAGAVGLEAAIQYLNALNLNTIHQTEKELTDYLLTELGKLSFIRIIGPDSTKNRGPVVSFVMDGVHPHDIGEGLSQKNICIRAGHHCCQILMDTLGIPATARISPAFYNTKEEINKTIAVLKEIYDYFK